MTYYIASFSVTSNFFISLLEHHIADEFMRSP